MASKKSKPPKKDEATSVNQTYHSNDSSSKRESTSNNARATEQPMRSEEDWSSKPLSEYVIQGPVPDLNSLCSPSQTFPEPPRH